MPTVRARWSVTPGGAISMRCRSASSGVRATGARTRPAGGTAALALGRCAVKQPGAGLWTSGADLQPERVARLPAALNPIALQNPRAVYGLLFRAAAETLQRVAADPKHLGAEIGFLAVLHT